MKVRKPNPENRRHAVSLAPEMLHARKRPEFRASDFLWVPAIGIRICLALPCLASAQPTNDALTLRPPRGEIPPSVWEEHGVLIIVVAVALVVVAGVMAWLLFRARPAVAVPPAVVARRDLTALQGSPEDGVVLSRASQVLRRYVAAAFGLVPGELTTAEFCRAVATNAQVGADLAGALAAFLREADERKFAPSDSPAPPDMVDRALALVERAEVRRAQGREATQATPSPA